MVCQLSSGAAQVDLFWQNALSCCNLTLEHKDLSAAIKKDRCSLSMPSQKSVLDIVGSTNTSLPSFAYFSQLFPKKYPAKSSWNHISIGTFTPRNCQAGRHVLLKHHISRKVHNRDLSAIVWDNWISHGLLDQSGCFGLSCISCNCSPGVRHWTRSSRPGEKTLKWGSWDNLF